VSTHHTHTKSQNLRIVVQLFFLVLFFILVFSKKAQMWMPIFAFGFIASLRFSRFYCGWICQMGTLFRGLNWVKKKLKLHQFHPPKSFENPVVRWIFLSLTVATMVVLQIAGLRSDILVYITILSVVVTLFFHESFWHNVICL